MRDRTTKVKINTKWWGPILVKCFRKKEYQHKTRKNQWPSESWRGSEEEKIKLKNWKDDAASDKNK